MLSPISIKFESELLYQELQIKFNSRHDWPTFPWVIALCSNSLCHTSFPHFSRVCSDIISMKFDSELLYQQLHIKFNSRYDWPTFPWVIALCSKFSLSHLLVFRTFLGYALTHLNEIWKRASCVSLYFKVKKKWITNWENHVHNLVHVFI